MSRRWGLGMTETLGPYSYGDVLRAPGYPVLRADGPLAERYEVRIADDRGRQVADGEIGEVQVRGYPLTPGLHKVERDGYLHADGLLPHRRHGPGRRQPHPFLGRDGDMIKTASSNVSPAEVEMEMQRWRAIHSAYVVGLPDEQRGQLVVAAVVPRDGADARFRRHRGQAAQAPVELQGAARLCRYSPARKCRCCTATRSRSGWSTSF